MISRKAVALSFIVVVFALTLAIDLSLPLGVVTGKIYLLAVVAFCLLPWPAAPVASAMLATPCVVAGYFLSPVIGVPQEIVLLNRGITLLGIWLVALALYGRRAWRARAERLKQEVEREHLLAQEAQHRLKNVLGQVTGIIRATRRTARSATAASDLIVSRIEALSAASGIVEVEQWEQASIRLLLGAELSPYGAHRFELSGDDILLTGKAGVTLGLVIHELVTNAAKYGALSTSTGQVKLDWRISGEDGKLVIDWKEIGGPPVKPPQHTGFGTEMIERAMTHDLGATSQLDYRPDGLHCRMELPVEHVIDTVPLVEGPKRRIA